MDAPLTAAHGSLTKSIELGPAEKRGTILGDSGDFIVDIIYVVHVWELDSVRISHRRPPGLRRYPCFIGPLKIDVFIEMCLIHALLQENASDIIARAFAAL